MKPVKSLFEIIRSANVTKFDNILKQNISSKLAASGQCNSIELAVSHIDTIHKELKELYISEFNTSKDQLDHGIQKLNEIFTWGKNQYSEKLQQECHFRNIEFTLKGVKSRMKTISVNVIIDTDVTINNVSFQSRDIVYKINFMQQGNKTLHVSLINVTLERIYLSVQGSHMSVFVKDSFFIGSGIQMNPQFNVNNQPVVIDNCTFCGDISYPSVAIINTTIVSVTNSRFHNLECAGFMSVVVSHDSQLELRNVSVDGCVCLSDTILIHHSNVTASSVRVKNNQNSYEALATEYKLLHSDKSILHIDNLIFEGNLNDILMSLESSCVNINLCTFTNNNIKTVMEAITDDNSANFTTIQNTLFTYNTIRGNAGGIILSELVEKVYLINVTLAHNNGTIVTCRRNVIEMMSCELTSNTVTDVLCTFCNVTVTNSVFQRNNGSLFTLDSSSLTVTNTHFSDNLSPDSDQGVFFAKKARAPFPSFYIDISFCTFTGNYATQDRGVINVDSAEFVSISNCTFYNNSAITGGIATVKNSKLIIKNSFVSGNSASGDGGTFSLTAGTSSIYGESISETYHYTLIVENTVFINNTCGKNGGVIKANRNSALSISNSSFIGNKALGLDGGVIYLTDHSTLLAEETVFSNNTCRRDGGVIKANRNSTVNIINSSFTDNKALGSDGGAIFIEDESSMVSEQCLFINNTAAVSGGAVLIIDHSQCNDSESVFRDNIASDTGEYFNIY